MWGYLKKAIGRRQAQVDRIERKLDVMANKISDVKAVLDNIDAAVAPIGTGVSSVLQTLLTLQQNAANPSSDTNLSTDDQALVDGAVEEGKRIQQSLQAIQTQLPQAQQAAAADPAQGSTGSSSGA
jgi:phage shock protein A